MKYLIKTKGKGLAKARAHIWTGSDTACTMWTTGGLKEDNFGWFDTDNGHQVCEMCVNATAQWNDDFKAEKERIARRNRFRFQMSKRGKAARRAEMERRAGVRHIDPSTYVIKP